MPRLALALAALALASCTGKLGQPSSKDQGDTSLPAADSEGDSLPGDAADIDTEPGDQGPPPSLRVVPFANDSDTGCGALQVLDGNTAGASRWSGYGDAWLRFDLSRAVTLDEIKLWFYAGNARVASFTVDVSSDGSTWTRVFSGESSGTSTEFESFSFTAPALASSIRLNGGGNNATGTGIDGRPKSGWNSIVEAQLLSLGQVMVGYGVSTTVECFAAIHCDDRDADTVDACNPLEQCTHTGAACGESDAICPTSCTYPADPDCLPVCEEGAVTIACVCGEVDATSGYCCEGVPQTAACSPSTCADGLEITTACSCGASTYTSGYCCDGMHQEDACPPPACINGAQITSECSCGTGAYTNGFCCENVHQSGACTPICTNRVQITSECTCGASTYTDGFCCGGVHQSGACSPTPSDCQYPGEPVLTGYYVSAASGSDVSPGTADEPFATLTKAVSVVQAGEAIWLRDDGVHALTRMLEIQKDGTAGNPIRLWACYGEKPVIDLSAVVATRGIRFLGADYWHLRGIEMRNMPQDGAVLTTPIRIEGGNHNTLEALDVHHNGGSSLQITGDSTGNLILNCDFHHNYDSNSADLGGNADGMSIAWNTTNYAAVNTVRGCRFFRNSDDGIDLFANEGHVVIEDCWAFDNGYVPDTATPAGDGHGFKLGGCKNEGCDKPPLNDVYRRLVHNCVAFNNRTSGFNQNHSLVMMELYNNTAYNNPAIGYWFAWQQNLASIFRNNIALGSTKLTIFGDDEIVQTNNTWNAGFSVSVDDFVPAAASCMTNPRKPDGSLPDCDFLRLTAESALIDAGYDVGLPYLGEGPDIGAFEKQ